jgi:GT2 family glycosyltransferase
MVTIGIKALNEASNIAATLESAVKAVEPFGGVVVLADSGSTDRTVEIAQGFPVRIVQFANIGERCCGAGAQLAFQHTDTDYFCMLDGDMVLDPAFLRAGIRYLEAHQDVAAVGGYVNERNIDGAEFEIRVRTARSDRNLQPGTVDRLDGGGLYRVSAIRDVGFFSDRNLHAFEEFDLGARLQSKGWRLVRIDQSAVDHYGHKSSGYKLMWRRVRSGYTWGAGEVLRGALGQRHLPIVLRRLSHIRNAFAVALWWILLLASLLVQPWALAPLLLVPLAFLWMRRGSLGLGLYSLTYWNVSAWGLLAGLVQRRVPPTRPLEFVDLTPSREKS